jgi:hypothetical protein
MDEEHYFEKVAEYKLLAKHEVGQNFLVDIGRPNGLLRRLP